VKSPCMRRPVGVKWVHSVLGWKRLVSRRVAAVATKSPLQGREPNAPVARAMLRHSLRKIAPPSPQTRDVRTLKADNSAAWGRITHRRSIELDRRGERANEKNFWKRI